MTSTPWPPPPPDPGVSAKAALVLDQVETAVVGKREQLTLTLAALLAGGHVLLEDLPGLGKTLAARSFAQALGLDFARAQFTPDLLPADLTGAYIYDQRSGEFQFRKGPLFTGLMLADEINRTPPKTQSALLEAMGEKQVTVEGQTFTLDRPFHVLATSNPVEYEGTYPLPEAQLDRFLIRLSFGYPEVEDERDILRRRLDRQKEEIVLDAVTDAAGLTAMQQAVEKVPVEDDITAYCVRLAGATRRAAGVHVGASPRGSLALILMARAYAVIAGRTYIVPEDVKAVAHPVLDHRVVLKPELWMSDTKPAQIVDTVLRDVPVPAARDGEPHRR
ncbi:MoxR family ATPase [Nesterenkonia salmonea]|uniref:MoxR family ATPase n=1 Tax=Nesterenkonia salmonea TaxID=1804987 RepID=A0A5R9B7S8_9MICC|nr:MoxR family ATPase [Nesterenkonia salmonea]TLP93510.1 MoxR family ATPase [Nesterenkonia salmonea]